MGKELVHKLITDGPVNFASASGRRVRAKFGGHWVVDTTEAFHVWVHHFTAQLTVYCLLMGTRNTHIIRSIISPSQH